MSETTTTNSGRSTALCSDILIPEEQDPPPPLPKAPLISVLVTMNLQIRQADESQAQAPGANALEWFDWDGIALFATPSALLICRDGELLESAPGGSENITARLLLFFSVHPAGGQPLKESLFREEVNEAIRMGLRSRFKFAERAELSIADVSPVFDPGVVRLPRTGVYVGSRIPGGPRIMLAMSSDWGVKTCYLTGEHFYPPAPLAFFYDGDPFKPVSPVVAIMQGFTISSELLRGLSARLNSAENLTALPGDIGYVDYCDDQYPGASEAEQTLDKWGGAINKWYRTEPDIPPKDIAAAMRKREEMNQER